MASAAKSRSVRASIACLATEHIEDPLVDVYRVEESAFNGRHRAALSRVLNDARAGRFSALLVWALDRLQSGGLLVTMQRWDRLTRAGVQVLSYQ